MLALHINQQEKIMKTSYSLSLKKSLSFVVMVLMLISIVACGKKEGNKTPGVRFNRSMGYQQPINNQYDPHTGQSVSAEWGAIGSFSDYDLRSFMYGVNDLGTVSSNMNASTGIRFRTNRSNQSVQMLVWDSIANQSGQAYFWSLHVVNVQNGSLTAQDNIGTITFQGSVQNGIWRGSVSFKNNSNSGGAQGSLGQFEIGANQMFQ
jgi:predicted small lipoprotein YifL